MKVFYNSKLAKLFTPMSGFSTIMLFGAVFTEKGSLTRRQECHESCHVTQYAAVSALGMALAIIAMFVLLAFGMRSWWTLSLTAIPVFLYYIWYGIEFLIRFTLYRDRIKAYRMIVFEREAYDMEGEWDKPCASRKSTYSFSFIKYYWKR